MNRTLAILLLVTAGCSTTAPIGKFPTLSDGTESDWVPMKTEDISLFGPSTKTTYKFNVRTGETAPMEGATASTPGLLTGTINTVINGSTDILSAREIRHGLSDSGDQVNVDQTGGGATQTQGQGQQQAQGQTQIGPQLPPRPPGNRPPDNRPPHKPHRSPKDGGHRR